MYNYKPVRFSCIGGQRDDLLPPPPSGTPMDPLLPIVIKEDEWYNDGICGDMGKKIHNSLEIMMRKSRGVDD